MDSVSNSTTILNQNQSNQHTKNPRRGKIQKTVNVCSWNIRRGLLIREEELKDIIKTNNLDVIFLVETDTTSVSVENDYKLPGLKTLIQNKENPTDLTRIVCLINEKMSEHTIIRSDLTSPDFPSLWIELENDSGRNILCGGFYREWAPKGIKSIDAQVKAMQIFTRQIETASKEEKSIIILGDANLCSIRWNSPTFLQKRISEELRETLTQCGITTVELGITYTADRLSDEGLEITSAIDHLYLSNDLVENTKHFKLDSRATDHLPVGATVNLISKPIRSNPQSSIRKRSMKGFTKTRWVDCLRNRNWERISSLTDVNEKAEELTKQINLALDECAPYKQFKVRQNFKPGLTEEAKKMMLERDLTRKKIFGASKEDKPALQAKYKQLRNRTIAKIRKDTINMNGERISGAKNEGETWRVINNIIKPKSTVKIVIIGPEGELFEEQEVADEFNKFFVKKIDELKQKIDHNQMKDPLEKIRQKMKDKNLSLSLKQVSITSVKKLMKKMAKKKSQGNDGIPQDCLLLGQDVIAGPLTDVINASVKAGIFPEKWKEAIVVPILKKGDCKDPKNYRPVSCLPAASKVLEKVVCEQLTRFAETYHILPNNQHGFRAQRSTMSALSNMQKEWIRNTEEGLSTGILVWDLSSAFDTLDIKLFVEKIAIYGADKLTQDWFKSYLSNRTQRVRIGSALSEPLALVSGVPQGGILSPIIFTIYTADMELWLKSSHLTNFADDTTTDNKGVEAITIKQNLEEDARNVLEFMASNGLVANQAKTEFLLLNEKNTPSLRLSHIQVGEALIPRTKSTKLLGVYVEESQEWNDHFKNLKSSLNSRLFMIRRISRRIPKSKIMGVVHSLWVSKLRYGLQLCTKTRLNDSDPIPACLKSLQMTQNRMLRAINGTKICDKISTKYMLKKFGLLSVNQLSAKIKIMEVWKSMNCEDYPITMDPYRPNSTPGHKHDIRTQQTRVLNDSCRLHKSEFSFHVDAARIWNATPNEIRTATSQNIAKKAIDKFCKLLPT